MDVLTRISEIEPLPPSVRELSGYFWNRSQYRLERWVRGELSAIVPREVLWELGNRSDLERKAIVAQSPYAAFCVLRYFFFPTWPMTAHIYTKRTPEEMVH